MTKRRTGTREWSDKSLALQRGCQNNCLYCVSLDTLVIMMDGTTKKIENLHIGDKIIGCHKKNGKMYFIQSIIKNIWKVEKPIFTIELENGVKLKSSADHRWWTDRGWHQVAIRGKKHWILKITKSNRLSSLGKIDETPNDTVEYYKGYLWGAFSGDGTIGLYKYGKKKKKRKNFSFRFAANDVEMVDMVSFCLFKLFKIETKKFSFTKKMIGIRSNKRKDHHLLQFFLTRFNPCPLQLSNIKRCKDRARGFLAGIFDAEGGSDKNGTIRFHNTDERLLLLIEKACDVWGFKHIRDKKNSKKCRTIRIKGGCSEYIRFFSIIHPRIKRKFKFIGKKVKKSSQVKNISKKAFTNQPMIDIETSTGNFIANGCIAHNCWARANALRFKQIKSPEEWKTPCFYKRWEKPYKVKRIMFPSTHDIQAENVDKAIQFIVPWLDIGNEVLIVSKPHLECVERLCKELQHYQEQITFRFTIGSIQQETLDFWEHDAPSFEERMKCLRFAFGSGWKTSVSSEPYLDHNISLVAEAVLPYVTDTVWIGKMNDIPHRVITTGWTEKDFKFLDIVKDCQTDNFIQQLYGEWKNNPKIRWKDSIKQVIGLPEEEIG